MQTKILSAKIGLAVILSLIVVGVSACGAVQPSTASEKTGPLTFTKSVEEAMAAVPAIKAAEAEQQLEKDPNTLIVDVRDAADIAVTGIIPEAINVSLGSLTYKADHEIPEEWRDPNFEDFSRPIITTCETGEMGALAAKLLKDMGYTNVHRLEGGTVAWKEAGYPTEPAQ
ncbi:MAG: sulfurtransferase [Anaerolineae bacterium]|nr:sulfurtransferase [Anaerolineae bacterium]MCQ3975572.1 sulfurtransferase [Anaerolineae bacterium]